MRAGSLLVFALAAVAAGACGGGPEPPPQPGEGRGFPPDLRGRRVILLPVQQVLGVPGDPSAEVAFAFTGQSEDVEWVLEEEVQEILRRSPGIRADTRGLPVGAFRTAEVNRVGDPLYGQLRRMAGLVDAEAVILPVAATFERNPEVPGSTPRVRLSAAVIEPRSGQVAWFGVEEGLDAPREDPRALASAAERLARTVLWFAR